MSDVSIITTEKTYGDEVDRVLKDAVDTALKVFDHNNGAIPTGPMIPMMTYIAVMQIIIEENWGNTYATRQHFIDAQNYVKVMVRDKLPPSLG